MKIALLIPSTSRGREWKTARDTYLLTYTMKTFGITYDKEHEYRFYIGIDRGDPVYDNREIQQYLERFAAILNNTTIEFIYMDGVDNGHLTVMWNRLFTKAYDAGYDYFFQCGDDISFETTGWVNACITALKTSDNIGMAGPLNNNERILTQSFVSRKHMELFEVYFPEEIINWCCDDWINEVYQILGTFYPLRDYSCINVGGEPRYNINNDVRFRNQFQQSLNLLRKRSSIIAKKYAANAAEKLKTISQNKPI